MLIDGILLIDNSVIANSHVESGTAFPSDPSEGRMFYLAQAQAGFDPGLYIHNGIKWVTGDVTKVTAGTGLTGGGTSGDISLAVDTSIVATQTYVNGKVATIDCGNF
jgi:hypothetical protein